MERITGAIAGSRPATTEKRIAEIFRCFLPATCDFKYKNRSLRRAADLSGAAGAVLSFSYRRYDELGSTNYVTLQVSADGGASWTELARFGGTGKDAAFIGVSYDISAYRSANTMVRFVTSGGLGAKYFLWTMSRLSARRRSLPHARTDCSSGCVGQGFARRF